MQNAVGNQRLKYVLLGVHFNDFLVSDKPAGEKDGELPKGERGLRINRDGTPNRDYWRLRLEDLSATLLSFDALVHSLLTISAQGKRYSAHLTPLGFNPMLNYEGEANAAGYYYLFRVWQMSHVGAYAAAPKNIFQPGTQTSENFEVLREIIQLSRAHGVHLHLIIYPYHAQMLELTGAAGLWALFEQWKKELTRIVEEETKNHPGTQHTARAMGFQRLYRSHHRNGAPEGRSANQDAVVLGSRSLQEGTRGSDTAPRIFNFRDPAQRVPNEFGMGLPWGDIDNHLAGIHHRQRMSIRRRTERASRKSRNCYGPIYRDTGAATEIAG